MWFWPFGLVFLGLLLIFLVLRLVFWRRWGFGGCGGWGYGPYAYGGHPALDADETLRMRLARGEIREDEYARLREALRK
jgi:uncharacterized membrane protein